jgi:hypothetical protein
MRRPGLWVSNGIPSDPTKMLSWRPGSLTSFYDYIGPNRVLQYKAEHPEIPVIIRFQHPKNWHQDPAQSARNQADLVLSKWPELQAIDPYVYFANEMNLHYENGDENPGNQYQYETKEFYQRFANWVRMTADRIKQQNPAMKLVTPPFAFGHHEDGAPDDDGNPKDGWAGYDYLADTIRTHFDNIITFHAYWGNSGGSVHDWLYEPGPSSWYAFRWRRVLKLFEHRYGIDAQVIIDEAGNMRASDPDFTDQVIYHARQCLADARVIAVTYFLWEDPTFSPGNMPNAWAQRCQNLDDHVRRLAAMQDVEIEPGPPSPPGPGGTSIRVLMPGGTVQVMKLEEYLRGVVPAEMPATWPAEALKVQAVAARTYALAAIAHPRHHPDADICTTVHCQAYNASRINPATDAAVKETAGQAILYEGNLANAYYSANCGGHTVGNETGFGGPPAPHLRPVPCVNPGPKNGHGVGMCQWGAHDMAAAGDTYVTILKHYYTGIIISSESTGGNGTISGIVRDMAGAVQPGRQVSLVGDNVSQTVVTDAQGSYGFERLEAGTYKVSAVGTDVVRTVWSDGNAPVVLDLTLPTAPTPSGGVVQGTVRDSTGEPKPDCLLMLTGANLARQVTTNRNGAYRFDALASGTYILSVVGADISRPVWSNGQTPVTLDLALPPGTAPGQAVIHGTVRDQVGGPLTNRQVDLMGPSISQSTTSDGSGRYRFENLPKGTFVVSIGTELSRHVWSDGVSTIQLDLTLQRVVPAGQAVVSGAVVNQAGVLQAGISVNLTGTNLSRATSTNASGVYRFDGLPAGVFLVSVPGAGVTRPVWTDGSAPVMLDLTVP